MNDDNPPLQSDKPCKALCKPGDHVWVLKANLSSGQKRFHSPACAPDNGYHVDLSTGIKEEKKIYEAWIMCEDHLMMMPSSWGYLTFLKLTSLTSPHKDHVKGRVMVILPNWQSFEFWARTKDTENKGSKEPSQSHTSREGTHFRA